MLHNMPMPNDFLIGVQVRGRVKNNPKLTGCGLALGFI